MPVLETPLTQESQESMRSFAKILALITAITTILIHSLKASKKLTPSQSSKNNPLPLRRVSFSRRRYGKPN